MDLSAFKEKFKDTKVKILVGGGIVIAGAWGSCTFQGSTDSAVSPKSEEAAPAEVEAQPGNEAEAEAEADKAAPPAE
jgi:hypothetical protein|tara:strand:- start:4263 stop:4493 length:231 start_codon:yes stop_codon:yes gene_type:complete